MNFWDTLTPFGKVLVGILFIAFVMAPVVLTGVAIITGQATP